MRTSADFTLIKFRARLYSCVDFQNERSLRKGTRGGTTGMLRYPLWQGRHDSLTFVSSDYANFECEFRMRARDAFQTGLQSDSNRRESLAFFSILAYARNPRNLRVGRRRHGDHRRARFLVAVWPSAKSSFVSSRGRFIRRAHRTRVLFTSGNACRYIFYDRCLPAFRRIRAKDAFHSGRTLPFFSYSFFY